MATEVKFGLLGPVSVRTAGVAVPISQGKQRALLAALLISANESVSVAALAEVLWGAQQPPTARVTLQNYVKRLRAAIQPTGAARIRTVPGGYLIGTEADELDLTRFEALQYSAQQAAERAAWGQAADQLRAALSLWRGEPLADVPSELLALREIPRLTEMRLHAIECRIDADLHLGRHAAVIAELRKLALAHPLRERLHGLLMLALYRDGQQAEALAAYQRARRDLIEELGAEPGPELARLQRRILAADPALDLQPVAETGSAVGNARPEARPAWAVVPRQLPALVAHFTGRTAELAALAEMAGRADGCAQTTVISAIAGTAGVGKTALAVQWAQQNADCFPDGQLYINLQGYDPGEPVAPGEALAIMLRGLGVPGQHIPVGEQERAGLFRSLLADRRVLLLLDNARSAEQVRPLLPGAASCSVVITSRDALAALVARDGARRLDLDLLPLAEATGLLRALIGDRAGAEPAAVEALALQCGRLPLGLRVAADLVARRATSLSELTRELADYQQRLDLLDAGGDPGTAVRAVFSWSCRHLTAEIVRAFRLLGLHPGSNFDAHATAALTGTTPAKARQLLDTLARASLVQPAGPGRYQMHDLLRAYAGEQAMLHDAEPDRRVALTHLFDYYLGTATVAMSILHSAPKPLAEGGIGLFSPAPTMRRPEEAHAWLDAHRAILVAVAEYAANNGWPRVTTQLASTVFRYLEDGSHYAEILALCGHARRAASLSGDLAAEAAAIDNATVVDLRQGRHQQAADQLRVALILYQQAGDQVGQARVFGHLGVADTQLGNYQDGSAHHERALELFEQAGDVVGVARALNNLGFIDLQTGCYRRASDYFERALALSSTVSDRFSSAGIMTLVNLGICEMRLGRYESAGAWFQRALDRCRECGFRPGEALALTSLGAIHREQGRYQQASDLHRQALALCRQIGDKSGEAEALNSLAEVFLASGESDPASKHLDAALGLARGVGDQREETRSLRVLGEVSLVTGELDAAIQRFGDALALATRIGEQYEQARALEGIARTYRDVGDAGRAAQCWQQAAALYARIGVPESNRMRELPS
jgi:DNA-binding SARP family transcriptional activator/Tfp pilus assembly protein PilF